MRSTQKAPRPYGRGDFLFYYCSQSLAVAGQRVQVFFNISVAVRVEVAAGVRGVVRIQIHLPLPLIGHSVMIRIGRRGPAGKGGITAYLVGGIDYFGCPVLYVIDYNASDPL